jgi:hypothetical protein
VTRPALADAFAHLTATAAKLRDNRLALDPRMVERGRMTVEQAADRARVITAIADQWANFMSSQPYVCQHERWQNSGGSAGASEAEMRDTLAAIAATTAGRSRAAPEDDTLLEFACATESLLWWQQPAERPPYVITRLGRMHAEAEADRLEHQRKAA